MLTQQASMSLAKGRGVCAGMNGLKSSLSTCSATFSPRMPKKSYKKNSLGYYCLYPCITVLLIAINTFIRWFSGYNFPQDNRVTKHICLLWILLPSHHLRCHPLVRTYANVNKYCMTISAYPLLFSLPLSCTYFIGEILCIIPSW